MLQNQQLSPVHACHLSAWPCDLKARPQTRISGLTSFGKRRSCIPTHISGFHHYLMTTKQIQPSTPCILVYPSVYLQADWTESPSSAPPILELFLSRCCHPCKRQAITTVIGTSITKSKMLRRGTIKAWYSGRLACKNLQAAWAAGYCGHRDLAS